MARYAVNFAITVWVDEPRINVGECGDDITHLLTDKQWNKIYSTAVDALDTSDLSDNIDSIERIE